MKNYAGKAQSYYRGYAKDDKTFYMAAAVDELSSPSETPYISNLLRFDVEQGWTSAWTEENMINRFTILPAANLVVAMSEEGVFIDAETAKKVGKLEREQASHVNTVQRIGESLFAGGGKGTLYRGDGHKFTLITDKFLTTEFDFGDGDDFGEDDYERILAWTSSYKIFFGVCGFSEEKVYFGDDSGNIVTVQGTLISEHKIVDSAIVGMVCDTKTRQIYLCGHNPIPFIGIGDDKLNFDIFEAPTRENIFVKIAKYRDKLYVADSSEAPGGIYFLDGDEIKRFDVLPGEHLGEGIHVQAEGDILWMLFSKALVRYDGEKFEKFVHPPHL